MPAQYKRDCQCLPVQNFWDRSCAITKLPLPFPELTVKQPPLPWYPTFSWRETAILPSVWAAFFPAIGGNIRVGESETFVTEACEYTNSFLSFFPKISVILNIDADHLDFFKDIDDIRHSFRRFAQLLPADGTLIINADTPGLRRDHPRPSLQCDHLWFWNRMQIIRQADITYDKYGHASFLFFVMV